MKTATELFKECAELINKTYPEASEVDRLSATLSLVGLEIQACVSGAKS